MMCEDEMHKTATEVLDDFQQNYQQSPVDETLETIRALAPEGVQDLLLDHHLKPLTRMLHQLGPNVVLKFFTEPHYNFGDLVSAEWTALANDSLYKGEPDELSLECDIRNAALKLFEIRGATDSQAAQIADIVWNALCEVEANNG